jgi:Abnormal spindle-like microcephaly-assoc'd, ASPM-SPD-2-Hydin/HYDIN/CFA65/VesB-like, Ig-like domain/K319L-like, PKD domain
LSLAPATLTFGNQQVGTTVTATVTVTNTGNATLTISSATLSGAQKDDFSFSPSTFPLNISAGSSTTVSVSFKPTAEGARSASLSISDNATGSPHSLSLSGTGTMPKISSSSQLVTFSETQPHTASAPMEVTISNPGSGELDISDLKISGANASEFAVNPSAGPIAVAAGASKVFQLTLTPAGPGTRSATLEITSNAATSPLNIALSGVSADPAQASNASVSLNPSSAQVGATVTVNLTGTFTNFQEGYTTANFGPGITVGGGEPGKFGPVVVTSTTTATAEVTISTLASRAPRSIIVRTGTHDSAATFTPLSQDSGPVANAGSPQFAQVGDKVYLDGSTSTGSPLAFEWSFLSIPEGSTAVLSNPGTVNPSFVADKAGQYVAQLVVDGVSANWVTISTENTIPVANAGPDQFVSTGSPAQLNGSRSTSADGDMLTYQWSFVSKPSGSNAVLSLQGNQDPASAVSPQFTPDLPGDYALRLTVNDGRGNTSSDDVAISTLATAPIANAGLNQTVPVGVPAQLDGSASKDPDDPAGTKPLTFEWKFLYLPANSTATFSDPTVVNPSFTPDLAGTYALELKVTDSSGRSSIDAVVIDTVNSRPSADAGTPKTVKAPHDVQLNGAGSADPDSDPLAYQWTLIKKPAQSTAVLDNATIVNPTFTADKQGEYVAQLIVSDGQQHKSEPATVLIKGMAPEVDTQPAAWDFGAQRVNTTSGSKTIAITNTGTDSLVISSLTLTGAQSADFHFTSASLPQTVAPGGSTSVNVTFTPKNSGARSATLEIADNAAGSPHKVALTGTGTAPEFSASPSPLLFGGINVGASGSGTLLINNTGTAPLNVSVLSLTGADSGYFSIDPVQLPLAIQAGGSASLHLKFTPTTPGARQATLVITADDSGSPHSISLSGTGTQPVLGVSPASITFSAQQVSTTSSPMNLTINNTGDGNLVISSLALTGANASDFSKSASALPITVPPGQNTVVSLTFSPTVIGTRVASLTITDTATGSPHNVALSGTGTAPAFGIAPASVTFANQLVGVQSAPTTVTITNTGTADLKISALSLTGNSPGDFGFTPASALPVTVTAGNSTTIAVTFTPSSVGARSASLSITDNAGGPHSVPLSGTGVTPGRLINPDPVAFGNQVVGTTSTATTVTITNNGTASLVISNLAVSGTNAAEFSFTPVTLPVTVTPGNNTTLSIKFAPTAVGARSGLLVITDNANGSPYSLALSGTGTAPIFGTSPASLSFGNQNVGTTSASKSLTVNNTGTANLVITNISKSGAQAAEFAFTAGTLPITVAPNSSVNVGVTFSPAAAGARSASLSFTSNAATSPNSVALSGTGTAPGFSSNPTSINFGNQNVGTPSSASPIVITNTGTGDLVISSLAKSGANTGDFTVTSGTLPITVTPGNTTTLNVTFNPGSSGARSATLNITDNAAGSPHAIPLSGTGTTPGFSANPTNVPFGNQNVNSTSAPVTITLSNPGTGNLTVSGLTMTGTNSGDFTVTSAALPITVAPGGNTTVQVAFKPTATGLRSGTLSIATNAAGSPHSVSLTGTGTAPTAIVTPNTLGFGSQDVNTTSTAQTVNISNTGNGDLVISSIAFSGGNSGDFTFTSDPLPLTVAPGGNAEINVKFAPTAAGARTTTMFITHNAATLPSSVSLTGTGIAPVIDLSSTSVNFGNLQVNSTANSNLTIRNTGTSNLVISAMSITGPNASEFSFSAAPPITIAPGTANVVTLTFAPQQSGTRTATLNITSNAAGSPSTVALSGNATSSGSFSMPAVSVGKDLEVLATASVSTPAPVGGLAVTISSADPTKVLLATDATVVGQGSISATIPQGFTTIPLGFYVQGLASSGTVQITVSAQGYVAAKATATLTPAGFVLGNPTSNFSTSTLSPDSSVSVVPVQLDAGLNVIVGATGRIRGGTTVNVTVSSSNTTVADILNGPATLSGGGTASSEVTFHPKAAGTAQISVAAPAGFSLPSAGTSVTATVTQPNITLSPVVVGMNMEVTGSGFLQAAAPSGGLTVTLTSPDTTRVKLSTDPAVEGTASINLVVPQGSVLLPAYYVQGFSSSGAVNLSASAPGYTSATGQVALAPSGFVIAGPTGTPGANFSTTTLSTASNVQVILMQLTSALQPLTAGSLRGGLSASVPVNNSNGSAGTLSNNPALFQAGNSSATLQFQPSSAGSSTLSIGTPSIGGFSTPASSTQLVATVTNPGISLNLSAPTVGANLEILASGSLSAPAPTSGLQITLTSDNPNVLLSADTSGTTAGAQSVQIFIPGGSGYQGIGFPAFYVQGLTSSGTAHITASATAWDPSTVTVNLAPSGLTLASLNGIAQDLGISLSSGNNAGLAVNSWQLNSATLAPERSQPIRGGLSLTVTVNSGTPGVGTVIDSPGMLTGGSNGLAFTFHPTALGTTLLTAPEPSGFSTPTGNGLPLTQLTAHVN